MLSTKLRLAHQALGLGLGLSLMNVPVPFLTGLPVVMMRGGDALADTGGVGRPVLPCSKCLMASSMAAEEMSRRTAICPLACHIVCACGEAGTSWLSWEYRTRYVSGFVFRLSTIVNGWSGLRSSF